MSAFIRRGVGGGACLCVLLSVIPAAAVGARVPDAGEAAPRARDEIGLTVQGSAVAPSVGRGTALSLWPGLRVARAWDIGANTRAGLDFALAAHAFDPGTTRVGVAPMLIGFEPRVRLETFWAAGLWEAGVSLHAGPFLALGAVETRVDEERRSRWNASHAFRLGGGVAMRVAGALLRIDTGLGLRDGGPEVHAGVSCSWAP